MSVQEENALLKTIIETQAARIEDQERTIAELRVTIEELRSTVTDLRSIKTNLEETLSEFRCQFFGIKSEKTASKKEEATPEETKQVQVKGYTATRKNKATREELYAQLPVREILCPVPENERNCDWCNTPMIPLKPTFVREEQAVPVLKNFFQWLTTLNPTRGSKLDKAVGYALNHEDRLCNYLTDGRLELSNNAAERCAKSYAIGRKNSLFHTSVAGANTSAVLYSLVETAKANNLNVFQYIYTLLLYMPGYQNGSAGLEQLMPWSSFIQEHCTGLIDVETITVEEHPELLFN